MYALEVVGLVAVAILAGSMTFFSMVVAPLIFVQLQAAEAGHLIRAIFPWYYLVIVVLAGLSAATLAVGHHVDASLMGLVAVAALVSRQSLMPRINQNRDRMLTGDDSAGPVFERLHRLSVVINGLQLIATFVVLVRLAMR